MKNAPRFDAQTFNDDNANSSDNPSLDNVLGTRLSRRRLLGAGAGSALVILGTMVRRAVARSGLTRGVGAMPAGAAHEAS